MNWNRPLLHGLAVGFTLPMLVAAPAILFGDAFQRVDALESAVDPAVRTYAVLFMPFTLLAIPGGLLGYLAPRAYPDRRSTWRAGAGLFLGASTAAALILWAGSDEAGPMARILLATTGAPLLCGFWIWMGYLLGASSGYEGHGAASGRARPPVGAPSSSRLPVHSQQRNRQYP